MKIFIKPLKSQDFNKNNQFTLELQGTKLNQITNSPTSVICLKDGIIKSIVDFNTESSNDYKKHYNDIFLTYLDDEKNINKIESDDDLEVAILLNQTANNSCDLTITAEVNFENFPNQVINRIKDIINEENSNNNNNTNKNSNNQEVIKSKDEENSNSKNLMNGFSIEDILIKKKQMEEKMDLERCIRQMKKKKENESQLCTPELLQSNKFNATDKKPKYTETSISQTSGNKVNKDEISHNTSINFNDYFNTNNNTKSTYQHPDGNMLEFQIRDAIMKEIDSRKEKLAETIIKGLRDANTNRIISQVQSTTHFNNEISIYGARNNNINSKLLPSKEFTCFRCRVNFKKSSYKVYYSCLFCDLFDLCSNCEASFGKNHGHPLIKHNIIDIKENQKNSIKNDLIKFHLALIQKENIDLDVDGNENLLNKNGTVVIEGNNFNNIDNQKSVNFGKHDKDQMEESVIIMENFINQK